MHDKEQLNERELMETVKKLRNCNATDVDGITGEILLPEDTD